MSNLNFRERLAFRGATPYHPIRTNITLNRESIIPTPVVKPKKKFRFQPRFHEESNPDVDTNIRIFIAENVNKYEEDYEKYLNQIKKPFINTIKNALNEYGMIKAELIIRVHFKRMPPKIGKENDIYPFFRSGFGEIRNDESIEHRIKSDIDYFIERIDDPLLKGSDWVFQSIMNTTLMIGKITSTRGGSYIKTPTKWENRFTHGHVTNFRNKKDDKCGERSLILALYKELKIRVHKERPNLYDEYFDKLHNDYDCSMIPEDGLMSLQDFEKFEKANKKAIYIHTIRTDKPNGDIFMAYPNNFKQHAEITKGWPIIDLLRLENDTKYHYCYIGNVGALYKNSMSDCGRKNYLCRSCGNWQSGEQSHNNHIDYCYELTSQKVKMPSNKKFIIDESIEKKSIRAPIIGYSDFEALAIPYNIQKGKKTNLETIHEQCGWAFTLASPDYPEYHQKLWVERYKNCGLNYFKKLHSIAKVIAKDLDENEDDPLKTISIFFHNFRNYDINFIFQVLSSYIDKEIADISVIPTTEEKMSMIKVKHHDCPITFVFKDSYLFLTCPLEKLVSNMTDNNPTYEGFNFMKKYCDNDQDLLKILTKKGIYPYDYMDSWDRFDETKFPSKDKFHNSLKPEQINDEDYQRALKVFDMAKNMGNYHDIYLSTDVLLLADVFENFRRLSLQDYKLDPANYITLPGMAFDALLLETEDYVTQCGGLELITDPNMYEMIERSMRGGTSMITTRYARANNKSCPNYNPNEPTSYIKPLDMNNMYGTAMCRKLPLNNFKWVIEEDLELFDVMDIDDESEIG